MVASGKGGRPSLEYDSVPMQPPVNRMNAQNPRSVGMQKQNKNAQLMGSGSRLKRLTNALIAIAGRRVDKSPYDERLEKVLNSLDPATPSTRMFSQPREFAPRASLPPSLEGPDCFQDEHHQLRVRWRT